MENDQTPSSEPADLVPKPLRPGDPDYVAMFDEPGAFDMVFDRRGQPISLRQWGQLREREEYLRIASDYLDEGHIWVSTVWLGISTGITHGPPMIFETMAFLHMTAEERSAKLELWLAKGLPGGDFVWDAFDTTVIRRYATEDEARAGHREAVDSLRVTFDAIETLLADEL